MRTTKTRTREPLEGIIATEILTTRPSRPRRLEREVETLLGIARLIARSPQRDVMQEIARFALAECKADSSGFSILEVRDDQEIFRWRATQGRMARFEAGWTPADFSPCGVCIERNAVQLFQDPERYYAYLETIAPIAELLLIPIFERNTPIGTIWVISHSGRRKFDREDARLLLDLADVVGAMFSRGAATTKRRPARRRKRKN